MSKRKLGIVKAARLLALKSVLNPDEDYYLRRVFRWYSRTFHTPLHVVPDLPLEDILEAYYEHVYEEIVAEDEPDKVNSAIRELVETEEERIQREMEEEGQDLVTEDFLRKVMEEEEIKRRKKTGSIEGIDKTQRPALTKDIAQKASLVHEMDELPDIKIVYDDDPEEVKKMGNWDISGELFDTPKK
jgi:hypothetical protein